MKAGIFITGTDTDVGKTVIAAGLALVLRDRGLKVGVMKPVATGCYGRDERLVSQDDAFSIQENRPLRINPAFAAKACLRALLRIG